MRELILMVGLSSASVVAAACASMKTDTGDETHFQCGSQRECDAKKPGTVCVRGYCRAPMNPEAGVEAPSEGAGGSGGSGGSGGAGPCGPCVEVRGTPYDSARGCFDLGSSLPIACSCDNDGNLVADRCRKRVSDGSLWFMGGRYLTEQQEWTECSAEDLPNGEVSCVFAGCQSPPASMCSVADTCALRGCDTPELDAQGCRRPACAADDECPSDERCMVVDCSNTSRCFVWPGGVCDCNETEVSCIRGKLCNSVETYGPRGEWLDLSISEQVGPCPFDSSDGSDGGSTSDCRITWTLTPDGRVVTATGGEQTVKQALLSDAELRYLVDGPELRKVLRDGIKCEPGALDVFVRLELSTTEGTLERDINGCLGGPANNIFRRIWDAIGAESPW